MPKCHLKQGEAFFLGEVSGEARAWRIMEERGGCEGCPVAAKSMEEIRELRAEIRRLRRELICREGNEEREAVLGVMR